MARDIEELTTLIFEGSLLEAVESSVGVLK
jgi:hypothetical protein